MPFPPRVALRIIGGLWLFIAPVLLLMAAISTVESPTTYAVQLAAFGAIAVAGFGCAVAALSGARWAAHGLRWLSWLGCLYYFGNAAGVVVLKLVGTVTATLPMTGLIALIIGAPGLFFLVLALAIGAALRQPSGEPVDIAS